MQILKQLRSWYQRNSAAPDIPEGFQFHCLPRADGGAFENGVELLNDDTTPMPFVLRVLQDEAGLAHEDAAVACALCHERGGVIVPMPSQDRAVDVAANVNARAQREAWPLRCRAVSALRKPHVAQTR